MSDLIDRQAAIDALGEPPVVWTDKIYYILGARNQYDKDRLAIETVPSAQRWIPCSERLPDNNRQVLVYARSVHFALAKYDEMREADGTYKMQWVTFDAWNPFYKIKEVIAWMPIYEPEPYRPEPYKEDDDG